MNVDSASQKMIYVRKCNFKWPLQLLRNSVICVCCDTRSKPETKKQTKGYKRNSTIRNLCLDTWEKCMQSLVQVEEERPGLKKLRQLRRNTVFRTAINNIIVAKLLQTFVRRIGHVKTILQVKYTVSFDRANS